MKFLRRVSRMLFDNGDLAQLTSSFESPSMALEAGASSHRERRRPPIYSPYSSRPCEKTSEPRHRTNTPTRGILRVSQIPTPPASPPPQANEEGAVFDAPQNVEPDAPWPCVDQQADDSAGHPEVDESGSEDTLVEEEGGHPTSAQAQACADIEREVFGSGSDLEDDETDVAGRRGGRNEQVRDTFPHYAPTSQSWSHSKEDIGSALSPGLLVVTMYHDLRSLMSRTRTRPSSMYRRRRPTPRKETMPALCRSQWQSLLWPVTRPRLLR